MKRLRPFLKKYGYTILLVLIGLLAVWLRFYHLNVLPPGLHPDEAANGLDIFKILEQQDWRAFYSANGGRESLFFFLQALSVAMFGNTVEALRYAPAVIGSLAVGAVYLWARQWFGRWTGLIAAFIMATTPWAITFSRDGFRASMVALFLPLSLYLMTKALQTKRWTWSVAAGVAVGAGFYTYLAWRLFPIFLLAMGIFLWIRYRKQVSANIRPVLIGAAAAVVTMIPMIIYAIRYPLDLFARSGGVSIFNPDQNHGNIVLTVLQVAGKTALMFNVSGDQNYRHNLGGAPELNIFIGAMFLLGLGLCLLRWKRWQNFGLLAAFGVMLLPELLTAEGIPHALRAIGALPVVVVMAAVGIMYLVQSWQTVFPLNPAARNLGVGAIVVLLGLSGYQGYVQYHVALPNAPQTYEAFSEPDVAIAKAINAAGPTGINYSMVDGYSDMILQYLTHNHSTYTRIEDDAQLNKLPAKSKEVRRFYIPEGSKLDALKKLERKFPGGSVAPHYSAFSGDEIYIVYTVPKS